MIIAMASVGTFLLGLACVVVHALFTGARSMEQAPPSSQRSPVERRAPSAQAQPATAASAWLAANRAVPRLTTCAEIARYLVDKAERRSGFRTMVAPETKDGTVGKTPVELARQIARLKRQVILVDWALDGSSAGRTQAGLADVLTGKATFEDAIMPLAGSGAHMIAAGSGLEGTVDRDRVNMLLDALDEAYDHIIIAGEFGPLRELFTTIEGCIDAAVSLATPHAPRMAGNFLGFHVADLDVIRFEQSAGEEEALHLGGVMPGLMLAGPSQGTSP
jgi:hypothetical protein